MNRIQIAQHLADSAQLIDDERDSLKEHCTARTRHLPDELVPKLHALARDILGEDVDRVYCEDE